MPHLSAIFVHPLKSSSSQSVDSAEVRAEGLALDRRFLAHTADGTFISGRSHPLLVTVQARWDGATLTLQAPRQPSLTLRPTSKAPSSVAVWKDRFVAWDQGDGPARWLSGVVGEPVRLAWLGDSQRPLRWDHDRRVTFADAAPLLLVGQASVDELSRRVGEPMAVRRFRPNLVVTGTEPFEEDTWRRIRIGPVEFRPLDGCGRCEFTTIDPDTGERHPRGEPVVTLEQFRRTDTGIYFGMNLMPLSRGAVSVGDPVTVLERRRPLAFGGFSLPEAPGEPWPEGTTVLRVRQVLAEAPGVNTYTLTREDDRYFRWQAGQYLTFRFDLPGDTQPVYRSYTLSSAPGSAVQVTVKAVPDGRVSRHIHERWKAGTLVTAQGVGGSFTLAAHPWPSYLFLGAGSGMTPLLAQMRYLAALGWPSDVAVHQSARTATDVLFRTELAALAAASRGRLTVRIRVTSEEGHLEHQGLVKFCPDLRDRRAFVCGPPGYRSTVRGLLAGAGFKVDRRYHEEVFGEHALEPPVDAVAGVVRFVQADKEVPSDGLSTVLQLAERSGLTLPSSCRSGDCGLCRVKTSAGEWVLACQTFPRGDLEVEL